MIVGVYIPARTISHDKGSTIIFCRNNLSKYKKVRTGLQLEDIPNQNWTADKG